jgi:hypothetical protein
VTDVSVSTSSFSPFRGQTVDVEYTLADEADIDIKVFDPDHGLVDVLCKHASREVGQHRETWDGKDLDGSVVPDEAYFFTIEARTKNGKTAVYDPTAFSGGEEFDITEASINRESNTVVYDLPYPARILIRIGLSGGPLLKTLVDWEPRIAGEITEHWNGMDADNLINLRDHSRQKMVITGFRLPENSVIAYGNKTVGYREYKSGLSDPRPLKMSREVGERPNVSISSHYVLPRVVDRSPTVIMSFRNIAESDSERVIELRGETLVHVHIDPADRRYFTDQQFEISFFLDGYYYAEQEVGYSPYNWVWDLSSVREGEHILTVNMSSFKDQIGVASKRIKVVRQ